MRFSSPLLIFLSAFSKIAIFGSRAASSGATGRTVKRSPKLHPISIPSKMIGAILPGNSGVELREFDVPKPGHGEVLVQMKASTICGSDMRCVYFKHEGSAQEGYIPGTICGHEPAGVIARVGPGARHFKVGDRVIVYHISGCGICKDCRQGFMISCSNDNYRKSYGFQRNGGMAPFVLAEEKDLISLPNELTFTDGAQIACGYGTVYEGLERIGISGNDAVLVVGLGPVGLAALQISKALGARKLIGIDVKQERIDLAKKLGLADELFLAGINNIHQIRDATDGQGCEKAIDCSGNNLGRQTCIQATRQWGKICFIGEGGKVDFDVSTSLIHPQKTIYGSWVTSISKMEQLVERIVQWKIHPEDLITHKFLLKDTDKAYQEMAKGSCGKVAVIFGEEDEKTTENASSTKSSFEDDIWMLSEKKSDIIPIKEKHLGNENNSILHTHLDQSDESDESDEIENLK